MIKIDAFCHILPPKYLEALPVSSRYVRNLSHKGSGKSEKKSAAILNNRQALFDLEARFRLMDRFDGYFQILNIVEPPVEDMAGPEAAVDLAKIANDEMAELVLKYPDRFLGAMACLPMNNIDAAMKELDRAIFELGCKGVQITSNIMDKPLDSPEFEPLFEKMNSYNLPIQIHPRRMMAGPRASQRNTEWTVEKLAQHPVDWPYETTLAMGHLVFGGVLHKYPDLKIITHHCGGLAPYQAVRITRTQYTMPLSMRAATLGFSKSVEEYYKMFYGDTAMWGWTAGLMCGYEFFGADHILFGTDAPMGTRGGDMFIRESIRSVEEMAIPEEAKRKIFELNARRLFQLPV